MSAFLRDLLCPFLSPSSPISCFTFLQNIYWGLDYPPPFPLFGLSSIECKLHEGRPLSILLATLTTLALPGFSRFHYICWIYSHINDHLAFLVAQTVKRLPAMWETRAGSLGRKDPLEKEMASHCCTLAFPGTEEPGMLRSMGSQRVGHDWATSLSFPFQTTTWVVPWG